MNSLLRGIVVGVWGVMVVTHSVFGQVTSPPITMATPASARQASWERHVQMEKESPYRDLKWQAIGPSRQGGRIETIACPPGNTTTIYLGVGSGNLWKTTNNAISWTPIFEKESTYSMGDVAVSQSNPDIVWLGTGETQPRHSGYSFPGTGVFKSTDAGATWEHMGLAETHHIGKVLIHPRNPDVVFVAAIGHFWTDNRERGLFRTKDGGKTWEAVLTIDHQTGVVDVVMDPSDSQILYAAAWNKTARKMHGPKSGIYKSTDGGNSWNQLAGGLPEGVDSGRSGLAIAPSNPNVVYAFIDNHAPSSEKGREGKPRIEGASVYRSNDKGVTWNRTHEESLYKVFTQYGWKFTDVHVAPDNENDLFIMGNRAYRSLDGGKTFARIGEKILRFQEHKTEAMHLDHHDMWIDPENPNRILLGNDGGLFMSYDRGHSWLHANNLPIGEYYTVHLDNADPYRIYGGTQDNASHFGPHTARWEDGKSDEWTQVFLDIWGGGDGFVTLPDPTDPEYIYYEHQHGDMFRKKLGGSVLTGAKPDRRVRPRPPEGEGRWRFGWYTPFIISHYNPYTLYVGGNKLFKSVDQGIHWQAVSPEFVPEPDGGNRAPAPFGVITSFSESRLEQGLICVGLDNGQLHLTRDDGRSWTRLETGFPHRWISRVEMSKHKAGTIYVSLTGFRLDDVTAYLYRSTDYGKTWTSIVSNLPMESINVVREDPRVGNVLYVGTDLGVYVSINGGEKWESLTATLPTTPVHDLDVHPRELELVIATHGRSFFLLDVKGITN